MKTAAATATPRTPPSSRRALLTPAATPASLSGTEEVTALATLGKTMEMPTPAMISGTTRLP
ncbi:hypothetical protein RMT89_09405 [Streptomyces sp. P17]|nr:hypothetical protein [Streptomyces sp. P17]MDT9696152.1 hypothetical protein [Streptomyces sp. P17]